VYQKLASYFSLSSLLLPLEGKSQESSVRPEELRGPSRVQKYEVGEKPGVITPVRNAGANKI
jgi:hypothetical protein